MKKVKVRQGRRTASEGTVRIYANGWARLSKDLATAKAFEVSVDKKKKIVVLKKATKWIGREGVVRLWYSNKSARSPLIAFASVLHALGTTPKASKGEYKASVDGETVRISLRRPLQK